MRRNPSTIMITALLLTACDPQGQPGSAGAADAGTKVETTPAKPEVEAPRTGAPGAGVGGPGAAPAPATVETLSSCLGSCEDGKMLPTDRATCRLNCENSYGAKPTAAAPGGDPVGDAVSCLSRCHTQGGATLDTCTAGCKAIAAAAPVAPAPAALDTLSRCIGDCNADKRALPTNRATCELTCAQEARVAGPAQPAAPR